MERDEESEKSFKQLEKELTMACISHVIDGKKDGDIRKKLAEVMSACCCLTADQILTFSAIKGDDPMQLFPLVIKSIATRIGEITGNELGIVDIRGEDSVSSERVIGKDTTAEMMFLVLKQLHKEGHSISGNAKCKTATKVNDDGSFEFIMRLQPQEGRK